MREEPFTPQDTPGHPTALVINQTMAQRFWPGESALGKRVVMKDWGPPLPGQIVGVVSDVKQDSLETDTQPAIYYSFAQFSPGTLTTYLIARSTPDPLRLAPAIRDQIWSIDRDQPVNVLAMDQIISGSLERRRFVLTVLGTFAALALLLAVVGIYGVIAYSVGQQTHEFGIRMALGAQRYQLLLMVLRQTVRKLAVGLAIGIGGALILTRLMGSLLFGISATDPLTFFLAAALLLIAALVASFIPARRAATVNPMSALRNEYVRWHLAGCREGILPSTWGRTPHDSRRDGGATESPRKVFYSQRSAVMGSTASARSDGTRQARAATTITSSETPSTTSGSCTPLCTQRVITLPSPKLSASPAARPIPTLATADHTTIRNTSARCAPKAMRMPNSPVRCTTL